MQNIAIIVFAFTVVIPAGTLWGSSGLVTLFGFIRVWPLAVDFVIAAIGGAITMAMYYPKPGYRVLGIMPGLLIGPLVMLCVLYYLSFREHVLLIELMIPLLVGSAPGILLYKFLVTRKELRAA
jgi:hypothetical protein